jgi:hypothetical protein
MSGYTVRVFTADGVQFVDGLDPWERSAVARHWNAVRDFLENGDTRTLRRLEAELITSPNGVLVGDAELGFDLDLIEREAFRGDVQFESIYES